MRLLILFALAWIAAVSAEQSPPRYKPSSSSEFPLDISRNAYGASELARSALSMGETAPDFTLPRSGGGRYVLSEAVAAGPVAIIFYRGHW